MRHRRWSLLVPVILLLAAAAPRPRVAPPAAPERVRPNENRAPAGSLESGVLRIALEARMGQWYPHGDDGPGVEMAAFGVVGGTLSIPGPLIRVRAGTTVEAEVRNTLRDTVRLTGLYDRIAPSQGTTPGATPPIILAPGERQQVRFRLDAPGTYHYWGTTMRRSLDVRTLEDAQLGGAIVVDSGAKPANDRIFVIGMWTDTVARAKVPRRRVLAVINGRSWPATERLAYATGDTARWRIINHSGDAHPMHLHGFYFTVDARGDGATETPFNGAERTLAVTELMGAGGTLAITWVPERAGNWLFHCHIPEHFEARGPLGMPATASVPHDHARGGMSGLVLGVTVRQGTRHVATTASLPQRRLRLLVRPARNTSEGTPHFNYALQEGGTEPPVAEDYRAAPTLDLVRGQPVRIQVVNRLDAPTAVHWHGIELESYFDGVPGFSGIARRTTPLIAPGDSFEVRFTPPHAGTFIYHTHADETRQQRAGLAGPIIVRETAAPRDTTTDIPILLSEHPDPALWSTRAVLNGSATPSPLTLRVGTTYRLRLVQMTVTWAVMRVELWRDSTLQSWTIAAKDGAERPLSLRKPQPAWLRPGIGEAYDVEVTPDRAGRLELQVRLGLSWPRPAPLLVTLPIQVVQ